MTTVGYGDKARLRHSVLHPRAFGRRRTAYYCQIVSKERQNIKCIIWKLIYTKFNFVSCVCFDSLVTVNYTHSQKMHGWLAPPCHSLEVFGGLLTRDESC